MALDYYLYRGSERIKLERSAHFFTAILPDAPARAVLAAQPGLRQTKQVLGNVYKIETEEGQLDQLMEHLRTHSACPLICHHAYCTVARSA